MNSFFIVLTKAKNLPISTIVKNAMEEMTDSNKHFRNICINSTIGFGDSSVSSMPNSQINLSLIKDIDSGCTIVTDARIDYKTELARNLGITNLDIELVPESQIILMSYLKWGKKCVNYLYGDFAFAIWDQNKHMLFCGRDHFGCRPLYYVDHLDYVAIASDPKAFKRLPNFNYQLHSQSVLDAICSIVPSKNNSSFQNIYRLEPAHFLCVALNSPVTIERYWDLKLINEYYYYTEEQAVREIRSRFIESLKQRCGLLEDIGVELSGGLDSSGIAACLRQVVDPHVSIKAFSHAVSFRQSIRPIPYNDELRYSSSIVKRNQINKHIVITGEQEKGAYFSITEYLKIMNKPAVQGFAMLSDLLYKKANENGIEVLLSGFGGDEGVTYKGGLLINELANRKEYKKVKEHIKGRIEQQGGNYIFQFSKQYIKTLVPGLVFMLKKDWRKSQFKIFALNNEMQARYKIKNRYFNKLSLANQTDITTRQYERLMHPQLLERIETSYFLAKANGIEYRYPFLDVKLVELIYSLPSEYKFKEGINRYLFRRAMEGILPDEVRLRNDKTGATIPNVLYRIIKDETIFRDIIEESRKNNNFHFVDYDKLHWMLDQFNCKKKRKKLNFSTISFLSPMSILILQKWQRSGKIDVDIKC